MHRQFITYQGKPLVVGEEDDLLTIPEPGIEVNEILGSAEVTEKIAEDVQVGDALFKYAKGFDYASLAPMIDNMHHAGNFFIKDGYLHHGTSNNQRPNAHVYRYDGDEWHQVIGYGIDSVEQHPNNNIVRQSMKFTVLDDKIYRTNGAYGLYGGLGFNFMELFGDRWRPVQYKGDVVVERNGTGYREAYSTTCEAYDGKVHAVAAFNTSADGYRNIYAFTYDPNQDGEGIVSSVIGPEPRSSWAGTNGLQDLNMIVHNNELYFAHSTRDVASASNTSIGRLYRWIGDTSSWAYCADVSGGQGFEGTKLYSHTSGLVFMRGMNGSQAIDVSIYDESTSSFSDFGIDPYAGIGTQVGTSWGFQGVDMFEVSGSTYMIGVKRTNYDTNPDMNLSSASVTLKYNPSTSAWDELPARIPTTSYRIKPQSPTSTYGPLCIDIMVYNGVVHAAIAGDLGGFNFYKFDPDTETWSYSHYWQHPAFYSGFSTQCGAYYNFSGQSYFHFSYQSGETTFKYIASGDASGSFETMREFDVLPNGNNWGAQFYETDGTLYLAIFSSDFNLYELNTSANQFQRVSITGNANFIQQAYSPASKAYLNGKTYILTPLSDTDPKLQLLEVSGTQWNDVSTSSNFSSLSLPARRTFRNFMEAYDGKIIITHDTAYTNGAGNEKSYSFDGSSWSEIPFSGTLNNGITRIYGAGLPMYTVGGELYCIRTGNPRGLVYKYNTSASVWEEFMNQTPGIEQGNATYGVDLTMHNGRPAMIRADTMSYSPSRRVSIQVADHVWKDFIFDGQTDNLSLNRYIFSHDGVLSVFYSDQNNNQTVKRAVLNEFFDQEVWQKKRSYNSIEDKLLATGIALESGSKGDTIRIQKVRR
jgi:hypothetical protein